MTSAIHSGGRRAAKRCALALASGLLLVLLSGRAAHGYLCTGGSLHVWPPSGDVPRDPVFVVEGTVKWSSEVADLGEGKAYLESEAGRTDMVEVRRFEPTAAQVAQIVFEPAEPLKPDRTYWMVVERDPSIPFGPVRPRNRWRVRERPDRVRPSFASPPRVALERGYRLGGSSAATIRFGFAASEEPVLVLADVGPDSEYYRDRYRLLLFPHEGQVSLYSGPCGRNFQPRGEGRFLVVFQLMDAGGNVGGGTAHRLTFEAPDVSRKKVRVPGPSF